MVLNVDETADENASDGCAGAARHYSGTAGGIALCQVAVAGRPGITGIVTKIRYNIRAVAVARLRSCRRSGHHRFDACRVMAVGGGRERRGWGSSGLAGVGPGRR